MAQVGQIRDELAIKRARVLEYMDRRGLDGLVLSRQDNFSWFTGGADNHVDLSTESGVASIFITKDSQHLICENIERRRIMEEELSSQNYVFDDYPWYEQTLGEAVLRLGSGKTLGSDIPIPGTEYVAPEIQPLRYVLTDVEIERYRWLGAALSEAMTELCRSIQPGFLEYEIAGELIGTMQSLGIIPTVALVGVDERIEKYRHPIPTDKELEKHAMIVTCGKKWGLICSITREVYFGKIPKELKQKHESVVKVDAEFIAHTQPGMKVATIFEQAIRRYQEEGYPDEWRLHHQGGAAGYASRDYRATPYSSEEVLENQAFAWNPSIAGTKSEDTILATENGPEILSEALDWPMIEVPVEGKVIARPDILNR